MEEGSNIVTCCNVLAGSERALKGDRVSHLDVTNTLLLSLLISIIIVVVIVDTIRKWGVVMCSIASVCVSVCPVRALTFESIDVENSSVDVCGTSSEYLCLE